MKIAVIHTGPVTLNPIKALFKQWLPEVEMVNIIDDSLLNDVMKAGHLTEAVTSPDCPLRADGAGNGLRRNPEPVFLSF